MVAIAANYLDNFFSNKSNAFIIAFLMILASWSLAFTSIAQLGLAISSVCVLFLLFVLLKVTKGNQDSAANSTSRPSQDFSYSNTLGWNTFPLPKLTEKNKEDLTKCAEDILLSREAHFPATIADLYDPERMPDDLRRAHERNDEVLERIYIGRKFKNDTERLEKLFDLYTKMTRSELNTKTTATKQGSKA